MGSKGEGLGMHPAIGTNNLQLSSERGMVEWVISRCDKRLNIVNFQEYSSQTIVLFQSWLL